MRNFRCIASRGGVRMLISDSAMEEIKVRIGFISARPPSLAEQTGMGSNCAPVALLIQATFIQRRTISPCKTNVAHANAIIWPEGYVPGFTENFASNEVIVAGLSAAEIWPLLSVPSRWPSYYANSANVRFSMTPVRSWKTVCVFISKPSDFRCMPAAPSSSHRPTASPDALRGTGGRARGAARRDWTCTMPGWWKTWMAAACASLTQETQKGKPAEELHNTKPNPMINGHQSGWTVWLPLPAPPGKRGICQLPGWRELECHR
ncbi:hypothetical protein NDY24_14735 [Xanthomonas hortorum pv. pelargonii]|nr:hypothetical protein NDY24_14735 [Xanthomonas hortorum pv. pelargonii]